MKQAFSHPLKKRNSALPTPHWINPRMIQNMDGSQPHRQPNPCCPVRSFLLSTSEPTSAQHLQRCRISYCGWYNHSFHAILSTQYHYLTTNRHIYGFLSAIIGQFKREANDV